MRVGLAAATVGLLASWRLQLEPGTIGLFHDWSIFPAPQQNVALAQQLYDGWYKWALGQPVSFPTEYPVRFLFGALGTVGIGGSQISHAFVFLVPAAAFLFAFVLTRSLTQSGAGASAAGFFYALNPVILNKLVSGQAAYLVAYCMLPLVLWAFCEAIKSTRLVGAVRVGAFLGLSFVQIQLGVVAILMLIVAAFANRAVPLKQRATVLAIALCATLVVHAPTVVGAYAGAPGYENRAQFSNVTAYVSMNSVRLIDAVRLIGYLTRYDTIAISQWLILWNCAMIVLLIVVLVGAARSPRWFKVFTILTLLPVFAFVSGSSSVLALPTQWLFTHVRAFQAFRELYHLMVVPALIYACAIAYAFPLVKQIAPRAVALVWFALLVVAMPMLTGDASGWVKAFPLQSAYGDILKVENSGSGRVLWLPMDQPLAFAGYGAGVDPMAVTERGSLWDYTLNWPLTALDTDVREGRPLAGPLRALGVQVVISRYEMQSVLDRFTVNPLDAERFFWRPINVTLPKSKYFANAGVYKVPNSPLMLSIKNEIALVPERLSVFATVADAAYAPMSFTQKRPAGPYGFFYDPDDIPNESLQLADISFPALVTSLDAHRGFAPADAWWWHRPDYADVPYAAIAFGRQHVVIPISRTMRNATIVPAWIGTPVGGRFRVSVATRKWTLSTRGNGEWMSRALSVGSVNQGDSITLDTLDDGTELAMRAFSIVEADRYGSSSDLWQSTLRGAEHVERLTLKQHLRLLRVGTGKTLGRLANGTNYRLVLPLPVPSVIKDANGFVLAASNSSTHLTFTGTEEDARIVMPRYRIWKLYQLDPAPFLMRAAIRLHSGLSLALWNSTASHDWTSNADAAFYPSALGTTIIQYHREGAPLRVWYRKSALFHVAYILGSLGLAFALLVSVFARNREVPKPTVNHLG